MIDFTPAANRPATASKRDFSIQMVIAVTPTVTDFFLRVCDKLIARHVADNPLIDDQKVLDYQGHLALKVQKEIHKHVVTLVESFHADFQDVQKNQVGIEGSRQPSQAVR